MLADVEGSRHHVTEQPPGDDRSGPTRTTTPPRGPERGSRGAGRPAPRSQVAPLVRFVDRVLVIRRVAGIQFSRSVTEQQSTEGFIDECRVGGPHPKVPDTVEKLGVHGRAQACAVHAISMPLSRWLLRRWIGQRTRSPRVAVTRPPLVGRVSAAVPVVMLGLRRRRGTDSGPSRWAQSLVGRVR